MSCTYKHGGDAVGESVSDDGEAGGDESGSTERFDHSNQQTYDGERQAVRASIHEPDYYCTRASSRGVDPYGTGGDVPPIFGLGGHYHECPLSISRVISATFYPCSIFLIS